MMNRKIILSNLKEAAQEIERLINQISPNEQISSNEEYSEEEFQLGLEQAYHHLNFAWNARHISIEDYRNLSDKQFNEWSKFPLGIEPDKT